MKFKTNLRKILVKRVLGSTKLEKRANPTFNPFPARWYVIFTWLRELRAGGEVETMGTSAHPSGPRLARARSFSISS